MQVPHRKQTKFSNIPMDPVMTEEKFAKLKKELDSLKKRQPIAAQEVARLAELGDFSENVEYQMAKGRLRGINNAILRIETQLTIAEIISVPKQTDTVQLGQTVTIEMDGVQKIYQILGSSETNPKKGIISQNSPIGAALIGRKIGDTGTIRLANKDIVYKVIHIG